VVAAALTASAVVLIVAWRALGPRSGWFSLLAVWVPMTALGSVSHAVPFHLPARWHALRHWELDGRRYEQLGVRQVERVLRGPPFAWFNPGLHLPRERSPEAIAALAGRMMVAEATHAALFAGTTLVATLEFVAGWWWAAGWMVVLNVAVNGYPVMLQRYNRAGLATRYRSAAGD